MAVTKKLYEHGDYRRYINNGCRCPDCRQAATFMRTKDRVRVSRYGLAKVPVEGLEREIGQLRRAGWKLIRIAQVSGVSYAALQDIAGGKRKSIWSSTFDQIHALWQDVFGESGELYDPGRPYRLRAGSGKRGPAIWPKQALKDRIVERRGEITEYENSKIRSGDGDLWTTVRADRTAVEMGFLPWEVWDGWTERVQIKELEGMTNDR